ncbi:MAG TPA: metallophosphoesterase [Solirubrobacteraceae bacterium]|nr:metallophosphoesterase [Solirubrobacteraceae bacterium]
MKWLLHMSDPHLGAISPGQVLDDEKVRLDQPDLETTQSVFRQTVRNLSSFVAEHGKPAVVVVSGDLSYHAEASGFVAFAELLSANAECLPEDPSKIVVVPGNHDVVWAQPAGEPARYTGFLEATRGHDRSTPLIDGVDFDRDDETGSLLPSGRDAPHVVLDPDVLVIPINSSNYCGTTVDVRGGWTTVEWEAALGPLEATVRANVMREVDRLHRYDIARVSRSQIRALGHLFDHLGESRDRSPADQRVRVAVLHHQLLPVSTREERKPFESLINLGLVRQTLREYAVDIVLHGHKHESGSYWDLVAAPAGKLADAAQRVLVISSPGHFEVGAPVMRALQLTGTRAARSLTISTFLGPSSEQSDAVIANDQPHVPLWLGSMDAETPERHLIRAPTTHVAYSRLQGLYALQAQDAQVRNLVCQIDDPSDAAQLPPDYPNAGAGRSQAWFDDMVKWWQLDRSELVDSGLVPFNHGERVYRRWGNQVRRAAHLLNTRAVSSRAIIELVAPRETGRYVKDERDLDRGSFPAFVLAELGLAVRDGRRHLDCFGYFRKQELRYWWPVNVAELARIQEAVLAELHGTPKPKLGRIVTFSAFALWSDTLPRVAVPEIDRLVDQPDRLWALAAAIANPAAADAATRAEWERILADLAGEDRAAPPQPKLGLARLAQELARAATLAASENLERVRSALATLAAQHASYAGAPLNDAATAIVLATVAELRAAVEHALPAAPAS